MAKLCREQSASTQKRSLNYYNTVICCLLLSVRPCRVISKIPDCRLHRSIVQCTSRRKWCLYWFGRGALCEMLYRRYKHIRTTANKNLMSIKIHLLPAINTKYKSDIPDYLKYQDCGFLYFPHKVFIPFLKKVDQAYNSIKLERAYRHLVMR